MYKSLQEKWIFLTQNHLILTKLAQMQRKHRIHYIEINLPLINNYTFPYGNMSRPGRRPYSADGAPASRQH